MVYKVVGQLVKNNRRVGFVLLDQKNKLVQALDTDILNTIGLPNIVNLSVNNRGFKLSNGNISDLKQYKISSNINKSTVNKNNILNQLEYFTGEKLRSLISSEVDKDWKERDIVETITLYFNKPSVGRILALSGLRGTGKTVAILQALKRVCNKNYTDAIFINIQYKSSLTVKELVNTIQPLINDKKYIVIDEVTRINNIVQDSEYLYTSIRLQGKALVISGTDSLAVSLSSTSGLYHRILDKNITFISFSESIRTLNFNLEQYIKMGGLYKANRIKDLSDLLDYTNTSIIDNILNTFTKNPTVVRSLGLNNLTTDKIRTIIFKMIYSIVYQSMLSYDNKEKQDKIKLYRMINLFETKDSIYTRDDINLILCNQLGIKDTFRTTNAEILNILNILKRSGLVIEIPNVIEDGPSRFYLTNPSIVNQVYLSIYKELKNIGLERSTKTMRSVTGAVFESCVISHAYKIAKENMLYIGYLLNNQGREIDLIIANKIEETWDSVYTAYYEIKLTSSMDEAIARTKWLNTPAYKSDEIIAPSDNSKLIERYIIYNGKEDIFRRFLDKPSIRIDYKGENVDTIEDLNTGTKLINGSRFMIDTKKYFRSLLE